MSILILVGTHKDQRTVGSSISSETGMQFAKDQQFSGYFEISALVAPEVIIQMIEDYC